MSREPIAIDAWATYVSPEGAKKWLPEFLHIFNKYRCPPSMTEGQPLEAMLAEMDAAGVDRIVLSAFFHGGQWVPRNEEVAALVRDHPDRFIGAGTVNVMQKPMLVAAGVEHLVNDLGLRCIRLEPYMYGDGTVGLPPNDKHYWPVYMKCSELGVAVAIQVGFVGREISVMGSFGMNKADIGDLMTLVARGRLDLSHSITATYPLDGINDALDRLARKDTGVARLVVEPGR